MLKKILIQFFLVIIIIVISILFYLKYINKSNQTLIIEKGLIESKINSGNLISDISYESQDFEGRKYSINSRKGIVNKDNPNIIEMEIVNAKITLLDGTFVKIMSDYAVYDNVKYDTRFSKNVEVKYVDHTIKSDDLVLSFDEDQLEVFNNLTYENLELIMFADKLVFDFKLKNTNIFNFDNSNVKIQNK